MIIMIAKVIIIVVLAAAKALLVLVEKWCKCLIVYIRHITCSKREL